MLCIASFIVLAILGLFSGTHRRLAREAFACVLRRVTLRPCDTGFDTKIKAAILSGLMTKSPKLAKVVSKRFEVLSWLFIIFMLTSTILAVRGVVNYYLYGSCNGLNKSGFCVFDPAGDNNKLSTGEECRLNPPSEKDLVLDGVDLSVFASKPTNSDKTLLFIGCYTCDYTRKVYPVIQKLLAEIPASYIFAHFPTREETKYLSAYTVCLNQQSPGSLWAFNDRLFSSTKEDVANPTYVNQVIASLGVDAAQIQACVASASTAQAVDAQEAQLTRIGVYGTPTIFINGKPIVGPKPYRVYKRLLQQAP